MKSEGKLEQSNYHHICKFALNSRNNRARGQQKCSDPPSPNAQCIHDDDDAVSQLPEQDEASPT